MEEAKQLAKEVNNNTHDRLNSNKGLITNMLEELEWLDNEIMYLSTDEEEITKIMVTSTEFEVDVQETLSVIKEVLTEKCRVLNIDNSAPIKRRYY